MAKYDKAQCDERVAAGLMTTFEKKFTCYVDKDGYVVMIADDGTALHDHLTFKSTSRGVVYGLETNSGFDRWWKKATGVVGGILGILTGPLGHFIAGATGWPLAKLAGKLAKVNALNPGDIEDAIRDEVGSHKAGRILLAAEDALRLGIGTPDQAEALGELLSGKD